jgi:amidase
LVHARIALSFELITTKTNGIVRELTIEGAATGAVKNCTFVAKDLFDVEGFVTGAGNPDWLKTHPKATQTASAVAALLHAGATLVGKSCTDELAYSIDGTNIHYGTPINPQFADRVPGGSSSGSASAVAAKLVDFALGTDTGGSIRIPASYCGIYGFRPTHGRISLNGAVPLAPGFDTVGWLARDAELLKRCGLILLQESQAVESNRSDRSNELRPNQSKKRIQKLLIATDLLDGVSADNRLAVSAAIEKLKGYFSTIEEMQLSKICGSDAFKHYRIMQGWQAWQCHGEWIESTKPTFAPAIKERFEIAKHVSEPDYKTSVAFSENLIKEFSDLLPSGTALCLPTSWGLPPLLNASAEEFAHNRAECMKLTCLAPLARVPQVTMPVKLTETTTTTGLSFLAGRGEDVLLLDLCTELSQRANYASR